MYVPAPAYEVESSLHSICHAFISQTLDMYAGANEMMWFLPRIAGQIQNPRSELDYSDIGGDPSLVLRSSFRREWLIDRCERAFRSSARGAFRDVCVYCVSRDFMIILDGWASTKPSGKLIGTGADP